MSTPSSNLFPSPSRGRTTVFWTGLVFVFLLALLPRMIYPVSRPMQWYDRSVNFWDALLAGDLGGTYQQYHPGVTTMWVAGLGLRVYAVAHGWSGGELSNPPPSPLGVEDNYPVGAGVVALSIVIAACIGLAYVLLTRLANWPVAICGGCLLALDPFYVSQSKVLHVDALLASIMLVSALFLLCYLRREKRSDLILSGGFAGLALLTKSPAGFLLPFAALAIAFHHLVAKRCISTEPSSARAWGKRLWKAAYDLGLWGLVAAGAFFLFWPAMWVRAGEVLFNITLNTQLRVETAHRNPNFFAGQVILGDPGWLYYVAVVAWKTTIVTLPASCAAILFLLRRWKRGRGENDGFAWWTLVYAGGFSLMMMLAAKKGPRYIIPTFPALDVLAAWGLVQAAQAVGRCNRFKFSRIPAVIIIGALVVQAGTSLAHHPYYDTHHNLLLGGSRVAQHVLPLGDQGEGLDLAARFLNDYPGAEWRSAGLQGRFIQPFQRHFVGRTLSIEQPDVDYYVFAVNSIQRALDVERWGEFWETCWQTEPLWSVSFDGVPYAWVCRAYAHDPDTFAIKHPLDVQLGDQVRLLGYRLSSSHLAAGDELTVTLFWQSDGRLTGDYHVFVHLLDTEGQLVTQSDGVPVRGERPTWGWRDTEVIQDGYVIVTDPATPAGVYELFVGMYDVATGVRLPTVRPTGEHLPDDRIPLEKIQVTTP